MAQRRELDNHRTMLIDIRNIMHSMKTLAYMETLKLERFINAQLAMSETIERVAADFLHFNPQVLPHIKPASQVILLIGSERGFCGAFNEQVLREFKQLFDEKSLNNTRVIAVGGKLHTLLDGHDDSVIYLKGADVIDEIQAVVSSLAEILTVNHQASSLSVLYHSNQRKSIVTERLLPPFSEIDDEDIKFGVPPLLNDTPENYFMELTEHYLFNSLHRMLYVSLMVENQQRIQHLDNATRHLDKKTEELKRKVNVLRQEEIIEEIEVMLLNASIS